MEPKISASFPHHGKQFPLCVEKRGYTGDMRKALAFSFVVLGMSSLLAQILLIRELLIVFTGNEYFIGWTLFAWLFWTGAGALLAGRLSTPVGNDRRNVIFCHVLGALLLPVGIALVRASRWLLGGVPGALPDLLPAMAYALVVLAPLCLVLGAQFVLGARAWKKVSVPTGLGNVLGKAYAFETAGFVAGGLAFSFLLATANEFRVAGWVGGLNLAAVAALGAGRWKRTLFLGAIVVAAFIFFGGRIDWATAAWRYPGQVLVASRTSIYGNVAVAATGTQRGFYENGMLMGTTEDTLASEQLAHFPMLWHPDPQRVLLVGGGFNGVLEEILKHQPDRVDYVELDPVLVELARSHSPPARGAALVDARVHTVFADGRFFFNRWAAAGSPAAYDVVIVNLPNPRTALLNRFYSFEFYREVRQQLAEGGVLAVRLAFSPDHLSRELDDLGTSIYRTLQANFATVSILPEYEIFYLATAAAIHPPSAADLIARYRQRGLQTTFVIPPAIEYRLTTDRNEQVRIAFEANSHAKLNCDARPIACFYDFCYWLRSFHPQAATFVRRIGEARWPWIGALALVWAGMAVSSRGRNARRTGAWAMGIGSFTLMACELVILLAFQILRGYLYYKLALILAALMLGMAIGTGWGTQLIRIARPPTLAGIHALAAAYAVGLALFLRFLGPVLIGHPLGLECAFLLLAAAIGGLIGFEFPLANRMYLADREDPLADGIVYGVDLIGSCLGALLIGLWALPVFGMGMTLGGLAALNAATALLAVTSKFPESSRLAA
jgi:spermidine synthase